MSFVSYISICRFQQSGGKVRQRKVQSMEEVDDLPAYTSVHIILEIYKQSNK